MDVCVLVPLTRFRRAVKTSDNLQTWFWRRIAAQRGVHHLRKHRGQMESAIDVAGSGEVASRAIAPSDRATAPTTHAQPRLFARRSATGPAAVALALEASAAGLPGASQTTRRFVRGHDLDSFVLHRPCRWQVRASMTRPLRHRHGRSWPTPAMLVRVALAKGMACPHNYVPRVGGVNHECNRIGKNA